jgi:dolichol-phosphate mannosyltransferase
MPMLVVCLPTYNEVHNLERVVRDLVAVFAEHDLDGRVLVIDDASPDGTGELADRLAAELRVVEVLHRQRKEGLGPAYVAGFRHVLAVGVDLVLEMDSDLSHDPADVPRLVAAADAADIVIGSRYVAGGGTRNWGLGRRLVSRAGCLYAKVVLGLPFADLTGGFKCFRREALERLPLERIGSKGYAFQIETTFRAARAGLRIVEVPIVFSERRAGGSKMSKAIAFEALWKVVALRMRAIAGRL